MTAREGCENQMGEFIKISDDDKVITLAVPLGTTVYQVITNCENICWDSEKWKPLINAPYRIKGCSSFSACHTRYCGVKDIIVSLSNIMILNGSWGKTVFASMSEAEEAGMRLVADNKKRLEEYIAARSEE